MSHEIICSWLGLPPNGWPPDHYRLLGLEPGEENIALIEQRVHQRLDSVRRYQMMHPDQATEAMNRLAQAFVCLTETSAKQAYDAQLLGERPPAPAPAPAPPPPQVSSVPEELYWLPPPVPEPAAEAARPKPPTPPVPPPVRLPRPVVPPRVLPASRPPPVRAQPPTPPPTPPAPVEAVETPALETESAVPQVDVATPAPELIDPVLEAAQLSPAARRGLSSKRALYRRLVHTRRILGLWRRLGRFLGDPSQRLTRAEAGELVRLLEQIDEERDAFPLLGEAGQPGYLLVALVHADNARARVQGLSSSQRESLHRDWQTGLRFLDLHLAMLRKQLEGMRQRGFFAGLVLAALTRLNEHSGVALLLVALGFLALAIVLWRR